MAQKNHPFNVLLSLKEQTQLHELAKINDLSAAEIIRQSIRWRHLSTFQNEPICTTGQRCFVPQMHSRQTPAADS